MPKDERQASREETLFAGFKRFLEQQMEEDLSKGVVEWDKKHKRCFGRGYTGIAVVKGMMRPAFCSCYRRYRVFPSGHKERIR